MQVRIRKMDGISCVELKGKISYDSLEDFARVCKQDLLGQKVVMNFEGLSFVGSVGIMDFLVQLSALHRLGTEIKYVGVVGDFIRLAKSFAHTKNIDFQQHASDYKAINAFRKEEQGEAEDAKAENAESTAPETEVNQ
tara:strand:- start:3487 stop:3900 length:414 start_codon:yes stop_codon:yes gene_type:complete